MKPQADRTYTAFSGPKKLAHGQVLDVAGKVKRHLEKDREASILIFDDLTGSQVEIDFRGSEETVVQRLSESLDLPGEKTGPGRPKLGVISREIGLLPRHWEWLALQPGGASVTLRKLVDDAKKKNQSRDELRQAQEATYKFMTVMAGNLPHFEEALRAFYAKQKELFDTLISGWPKDVREHVSRLALPTFEA